VETESDGRIEGSGQEVGRTRHGRFKRLGGVRVSLLTESKGAGTASSPAATSEVQKASEEREGGRGMASDEDFDVFARELIPNLIRAVRRLAPVGADVEAIAAEALARGFARWASLGPTQYRAAWVYRVASNLAYDEGRRAARARRFPTFRPTSEGFDDDAAERLDLRAALSGLSARQRDAFVLRYVVDMSLEEIGAALGISPATVRKHLDRARTSLRSSLGPKAEEVINEHH
jgi:RNA polymerase sigma factor (sigma-70 family)